MTVAIKQCQVLIIGAGPVGLLLALMLHQRGVDISLVERQKALYPLPRAVALDHESRRLFGSVGLSNELDQILEEVIGKGGEDGTNFVWRDKDLKLVADLYFEAPTRSGFPFASSFNQPEVEGLLEAAVLKRNIPLIRGYSVTAINQDADGVNVHLAEFLFKPVGKGTGPNGVVADGVVNSPSSSGSKSPSPTPDTAEGAPEKCIRASYVVGCDGANSTVRRLQEFTMTDLNFENDWLVADILLVNGYTPPKFAKVGAAQICDPTRPTTAVWGGKGRKRLEFMRLPGETQAELLEDDKVWALLAEWGFNKTNCVLERKVIYTFKARWANEFFKGRVALAGDALHQMPPFIGQGLNSGFRDAAALAWRLPLIVSSVASPEKLLKSYQVERLDHIRKLTEYCINLGAIICETDADASKKIHAEMRAAPPGPSFDPPLGRPGVLTSQKEAGHLSLQRPLKISPNGASPLFDQVHGYGWMLITYGDKSVEERLSVESRDFFVDVLKGKCVAVTAEEDDHGEYREWFSDGLGLDHVVLVRPDFYVFGHASAQEVNDLVEQLRDMMRA